MSLLSSERLFNQHGIELNLLWAAFYQGLAWLKRGPSDGIGRRLVSCVGLSKVMHGFPAGRAREAWRVKRGGFSGCSEPVKHAGIARARKSKGGRCCILLYPRGGGWRYGAPGTPDWVAKLRSS